MQNIAQGATIFAITAGALEKLDPDLGVPLLSALAERLRYLTGRLK